MTRLDMAVLGSSMAMGSVSPSTDSLDLHADIALRALEDAAVPASQIDGIVTLGSMSQPHGMHPLVVADRLGLSGLSYAGSVHVGGASAVAALNRIAGALAARICRTVLLVAADDQRTGLRTSGALASMFENRHPMFEQPYAPTTAALYALHATRYLHDNRAHASMLAHAVVASRAEAIRSGHIPASDACSLDEVNASREIASPLRLLHCSKVSDGGAAVVLGSADQTSDVRMVAAAEHHRSGYFIHGCGSGPVGAGAVAGVVLREAGRSVEDLRLAYIYDAFASSIAIPLEEIGLAPRGATYHCLRDGELSWEGRVTVNPHGGLLSLGHPGYPAGMVHVVGAVTALKHGPRPAHADAALVHGSGGVMTTQAAALLERV